ncbi:MAG: ester cyclase [Parachlamydiaceae bacterium]|nr:ester cyclase [Parachlamydiaceae bacterium]
MNQTTDYKSIAEEYAHRIWNKKDMSVIDDLLHPKIVIHSLLGDYQGTEPMKKVVEAWLNAFPDLVVKNNSVICEQDLVVIQWQAQGTHLWEFKGIQATGLPVAYEGVTIYKICTSKIIEYWAYLDMQHLLHQIKKS